MPTETFRVWGCPTCQTRMLPPAEPTFREYKCNACRSVLDWYMLETETLGRRLRAYSKRGGEAVSRPAPFWIITAIL